MQSSSPPPVQAAQDAAREAAQQIRVHVQDLRDQARALRDLQREQSLLQQPQDYESIRRDRQQKMEFAGFVIFVVAAVVILRPVARAFARRLDGARPVQASLGNETQEALHRMEQAIDAMAIEIERISEGQRFTTKLLSGRDDAKIPVGARDRS